MTRVLALSNLYPPHAIGGYELSCRDVLDRFAGRGHEVAVLTSDVRVDGIGDERVGHPVDRSLRLYWRDHELVEPGPLGRLAVEVRNQRALDRALRRHRPEVVSVWNMGAASLGLLASVAARGIPLVLVVCDDWLVYGPRLDAWTRALAGRPLLSRVVRAVTRLPTGPPDLGPHPACFVSDFVRRRAESEGAWRFARWAVVGSGIDRGDFPLDESRGAAAWSWRLLYVGRLDPRKGVETLLRAVAALPGAELELVGPGPDSYRERLESLTQDLGIAARVRFAVVDRRRLAERYRAADAVVFPSEWDEPFGLVPLEAMACGTPVVATATGGAAEYLVDGGNALLFPPRDDASLAAALRRLAGDAALRERLVEAGFETAARHDVDRLADVLERWHVEAASGGAEAVAARGA